MEKETTRHGGARAGAGRKAPQGARERLNVRLLPEVLKLLPAGKERVTFLEAAIRAQAAQTKAPT